MAKEKLTKKQDAFVKAYLLNGGNATQAAIDAGYKPDNAAVVGCENLSKLNIKKAIEKHQQEANKVFIWSKETKLLKLEEIINHCIDKNDDNKMHNPQSAIAAMKEHNLMQGDNAPTESTNTLIIDSGTDEW